MATETGLGNYVWDGTLLVQTHWLDVDLARRVFGLVLGIECWVLCRGLHGDRNYTRPHPSPQKFLIPSQLLHSSVQNMASAVTKCVIDLGYIIS